MPLDPSFWTEPQPTKLAFRYYEATNGFHINRYGTFIKEGDVFEYNGCTIRYAGVEYASVLGEALNRWAKPRSPLLDLNFDGGR